MDNTSNSARLNELYQKIIAEGLPMNPEGKLMTEADLAKTLRQRIEEREPGEFMYLHRQRVLRDHGAKGLANRYSNKAPFQAPFEYQAQPAREDYQDLGNYPPEMLNNMVKSYLLRLCAAHNIPVILEKNGEPNMSELSVLIDEKIHQGAKEKQVIEKEHTEVVGQNTLLEGNNAKLQQTNASLRRANIELGKQNEALLKEKNEKIYERDDLKPVMDEVIYITDSIERKSKILYNMINNDRNAIYTNRRVRQIYDMLNSSESSTTGIFKTIHDTCNKITSLNQDFFSLAKGGHERATHISRAGYACTNRRTENESKYYDIKGDPIRELVFRSCRILGIANNNLVYDNYTKTDEFAKEHNFTGNVNTVVLKEIHKLCTDLKDVDTELEAIMDRLSDATKLKVA